MRVFPNGKNHSRAEKSISSTPGGACAHAAVPKWLRADAERRHHFRPGHGLLDAGDALLFRRGGWPEQRDDLGHAVRGRRSAAEPGQRDHALPATRRPRDRPIGRQRLRAHAERGGAGRPAVRAGSCGCGRPRWRFLASSPLFALWFVLATMAWCIFTLQDSVLAGMQQAIWVPIENTIFAVAKIALLLLFAWPAARYGIFASWTIPGAAVLLPISYLIFRRLLPRHAPVQRGPGRAAGIAPDRHVRRQQLHWLDAVAGG